MKRNHKIDSLSDYELRLLEAGCGLLLGVVMSSTEDYGTEAWKSCVKSLRRVYNKLRVARGTKPVEEDGRVDHFEDAVGDFFNHRKA